MDYFKNINLEEICNYAREIRQYIHANPELSFEEFNTTKLVVSELKSIGIEVIEFDDNLGAVGILKGLKKGIGSVIALRADMDALPIKECTGKIYSSKTEGIMHACGHDGHTAILLGIVKVLYELREHFSHTIKFIFQPSEELDGGAVSMIRKGVLENPKADVIVALHSGPEIELGKIGIRKGPIMSSSDEFHIRVLGQSGHGAYPELAIDPILPASNIVMALQNMITRRVSRDEKIVMSVCKFNSGNTSNIIPNYADLSGTVRCQNERLRMSIASEMEKVIKGITECFGCSYEFNYKEFVPVLENDQGIVDKIKSAAVTGIGKDNVVIIEKARMGSEDFAVYIKKVPKAAMFRLGVTEKNVEAISLHNEKFDFNDEAIITGIKVMIQFVLDY